MTDTTLDAIEARTNAATDGPWFQGRKDHRYESACDVYSKRERNDPDSHDIASYIWSAEDAEFIAHSRTDVPRLVAALRDIEALAQMWENVTKVHHEEDSVPLILTYEAHITLIRDAINEHLGGE